MHNGTPYHNAKNVQEYLKKLKSLYEWADTSPEVNQMKNKVVDKHSTNDYIFLDKTKENWRMEFQQNIVW